MFLPWFIGQLFDPVGPFVTMLSISVFLSLDLIILGVTMTYVGKLQTLKTAPLDSPG